ncbi:MAG: hypothetical protein Q8O82_14675 [Pseudorhodobacter sp.]|nr:hypothetical protein [Pseudorhodobacter sp.]
MIWSLWWVWVAGGFALGILEVLMPGYIFLGFAIGAMLTGALVWLGLMGTSLPALLVVFALASLAAWAVLRHLLGVRRGQIKIWDRDINDQN